MLNTIINNCTGAIEYGNIVYYSHLTPISISLVLIIFISIKIKRTALSLIFCLFLLTFSLWLLFDIVTWVSTNYLLITIFWIPLDLINVIFYLLAAYFFTFLLYGKDIDKNIKIFILIIISPIVLMTMTGNSISDFDIQACEIINNTFVTIYKLIIELIVIIYIIFSARKVFLSAETARKKKYAVATSLVLITFLIVFSVTEFISSQTGIYEINLYSLLVSPIFLFTIILILINSKVFEVKFYGSQLVGYIIAILVLLQSILTISWPEYILNLLNFVIFISFSALLIHVSKQEELNLQKSLELEKRALRELQKLSETKDNFIMIAQHNLRVPITNINNRINFLLSQNHNSDSESRDELSEISSSVKHIRDIANDFKSIAKLKVGAGILNPADTSVLPIISEILNELKIDIENLNIKVSYPTEEKSWPIIKIDRNKIKEALVVILENAIKYNRKGGNINIETSTTSDDFIITIRNSGIGITVKEKENLLNRSFYRGERAKEINTTGMGIGLSLSKSILEAHHGTLGIESQGENLGAMITINIPLNFLNMAINKA